MKFLPPEELEKVTKALWAPTPISTRFSITEDDNKFVLDNLQYRGELYRVEWGKELLDNGRSQPQGYWVTQFPDRIPDAPLYHATIMALYRNKEGKFQQSVEGLKEKFLEDFNEFGLMTTSTRLVYNASGEDKVMHGYGSRNKQIVSGKLVGIGGYRKSGYRIKNRGFKRPLKALLGATDLKEMALAYKWLSEMNLWLSTFRPSIKGCEYIEFALSLGFGDDDGFYFHTHDTGCILPVRGASINIADGEGK